MARLSLLTGLIMATISVAALAQMGQRDASASVKSDSLGMPGQSADPMNQYLQQKSLNNLPGQHGKNSAKSEAARPAMPAELIAGAAVSDKTGVAIGKIESVDSDGVVIATEIGKVKIPADAFGHNKKGLLLDTSKAQFDATVAKANAAS